MPIIQGAQKPYTYMYSVMPKAYWKIIKYPKSPENSRESAFWRPPFGPAKSAKFAAKNKNLKKLKKRS